MEENKPLLSMTDEERETAFDNVSEPLHLDMLEEARQQTSGKEHDVMIAVAVLTTSDGVRHICHSAVEYGDGDATGNISDFVEKSQKLLREGETLHLRVVGCTLPADQLKELST